MKYITTYYLFEGVGQEDVDRVLDKMSSQKPLNRFDKFVLDSFSKRDKMTDKEEIINDIIHKIYVYGGGELSVTDLELQSNPVYDDYQLMEYFGTDGIMIQNYTEDWDYVDGDFPVRYEDLDIEKLKELKTIIDKAIYDGVIEAV